MFLLERGIDFLCFCTHTSDFFKSLFSILNQFGLSKSKLLDVGASLQGLLSQLVSLRGFASLAQFATFVTFRVTVSYTPVLC